MQSHRYQFAFNRGNKRVWLEGSRLLDANVTRGREYQQTITDALIKLDFAVTPDGGRVKRVAGTDKRPIIDICSRAITNFAGDARHYQATFDNTGNAPVIMITRD